MHSMGCCACRNDWTGALSRSVVFVVHGVVENYLALVLHRHCLIGRPAYFPRHIGATAYTIR
jgi:hypothetical protein